MTELTITIDDKQFERLRKRAEQMGLTSDALARKMLDDFLDISDEEFLEIVNEILTENAELYRRLA